MPPLRTHEAVAAAAAEFERRRGETTNGRPPYGVFGTSALLRLFELYGFDIILDTLLDMMHIGSGIVQRHILPSLKGAKVEKSGNKRKRNPKDEKIDSSDEDGSEEEVTPSTELAEKRNDWKVSNALIESAEKLNTKLNVPPGLAPPERKPFTNTGKI